MKAYKLSKKTIPRILVSREQHWIDAIRGHTKPVGGFDHAGPFTETVLLGNLALLFPGRPLVWDGANMRVTNVPEANEYVQHHCRTGWSL